MDFLADPIQRQQGVSSVRPSSVNSSCPVQDEGIPRDDSLGPTAHSARQCWDPAENRASSLNAVQLKGNSERVQTKGERKREKKGGAEGKEGGREKKIDNHVLN